MYQPVTAQEAMPAGKVFFIELFGPGVMMSANYTARFQKETRTGAGFRIGAGYGMAEFQNRIAAFFDDEDFDLSHFSNRSGTVYTVPAGLNYVFGKPNRATSFEAGAGVTFLSKKVSMYNYEISKPGHLLGYISLVFRVAPVNGGASVQVGFTPIIGTAGDLYPMGAVGVGYAF